jgi:hypothetical protein
MVFDDVSDLTVSGFRTDTMSGAAPVLWLNNAIDALIGGSRTSQAKTFVRVSGSASKGISLIGNDLTHVEAGTELVGVPHTAVIEQSNAVGTRGMQANPGRSK